MPGKGFMSIADQKQTDREERESGDGEESDSESAIHHD
jgi:hypothetical protein